MGGVLVLLGLAFLTSYRVAVFQSNLTVWTDAASRAPDKPRPAINLAAALIQQQELGSAELWLEHAADLSLRRSGFESYRAYDLAQANLAVIRLRQGRRAEAAVLVAQEGPASARSARLDICQQFGPCPAPEPR